MHVKYIKQILYYSSIQNQKDLSKHSQDCFPPNTLPIIANTLSLETMICDVYFESLVLAAISEVICTAVKLNMLPTFPVVLKSDA